MSPDESKPWCPGLGLGAQALIVPCRTPPEVSGPGSVSLHCELSQASFAELSP